VGVEIREVTAKRWDDVVALFDSPGAPKYCWCMAWRGSADERESNASRKAAIRKRIRDEVPVGLLAYVEDRPVGWCSVAPRDTHRPLGGVDDDDLGIWSIVCFFVLRDHRGKGLMRALLRAAVDHAREKGARVVEAYPVDPDSPSYRFMGFVEEFEVLGFDEE
jgi:GNAT superfamily N-acetyltransferase